MSVRVTCTVRTFKSGSRAHSDRVWSYFCRSKGRPTKQNRKKKQNKKILQEGKKTGRKKENERMKVRKNNKIEFLHHNVQRNEMMKLCQGIFYLSFIDTFNLYYYCSYYTYQMWCYLVVYCFVWTDADPCTLHFLSHPHCPDIISYHLETDKNIHEE